MCPSLNVPLLLYFTLDDRKPSVFSEPKESVSLLSRWLFRGGGGACLVHLNSPALVEGCFPVNTRVWDTHGVSKVEHPPTFRFLFCAGEGAL